MHTKLWSQRHHHYVLRQQVLRECWVHGIIDENTLVWGQGLVDWLPIRNVRTLVAQIRTPEGASLSDRPRAISDSMAQCALQSHGPPHALVTSACRNILLSASQCKQQHG